MTFIARAGPGPSDTRPVVYGYPAVNFYDWMLALHLLAAFAIAAALVLYSVLVFDGRRTESPDRRQLLFRIAPMV